jgi:Kdo2-lipid IVA lauroyltransferase/acyltransferase
MIGPFVTGERSMNPKIRNRWLDYTAYLAVRLLVCVVQGVPLRYAFGLGELLAKLLYRLDARHRKVAAENLRFAFPEKSEPEIDQLVRDCFEHFSTLLIEIILLPRKFHISTWGRHGDLVEGVEMMRHMLADRPMLIVTAHYGNWELAGFALGALGFRTYAIARVLDNPYLEKYLSRFRQATGQTIIAKKDDFQRLEAAMKMGGKVATLADQDAGERGVFVNFFGRPASAHKAVALMAIEFQAVMLVIGVKRRTQTRDQIGPYDLMCEDVIDPREYEGRPDAVKAITQRYHDGLARLIRKAPEQYFWLHRRWKTQPMVKKNPAKKAA